MTPAHPGYDEMQPVLLQILRENAAGIDEYDLLNQLAEHFTFFRISGLDSLALFQRHFWLFHCLYRLQMALGASNEGFLTITALSIRLYPYAPDQTGQLAEPDPLRTYYLDARHLTETRAEDVNEMLGQFWHRLAKRDTRSEALRILGLSDPVDDKTIKQRYRKLVMTHHPDRGGDLATIQLINAAMTDLFGESGPLNH